MKKIYAPLVNFLKNSNKDYYKSTMEEIERIIGSDLPPPAYDKDTWWSPTGGYSLAKEIMKSGWKVTRVHFHTEEVEFEKATLTAFQKLRSYILNRMTPLAIYQSLIITTLVKMEGTSSKKTLSNQIKAYHQGNPNFDHEWLPLYEVLKENGILKQKGDNFSLNGYQNFNNEQKQEVVELCEQKIKDFKSKDIKENIQEELKKIEDEYAGIKFILNQDFGKFLEAVPKASPFQTDTGRSPMNAERFQTLYRLLYGSALQIKEEALKLRVKDLDLQNRLIFVGGSRNPNDLATILPCDIPYLKHHIDGMEENDLLFNVNRQMVWQYAKMIGRKAGLKITVKKVEKTIEGASADLFRDSRARQMYLDRATDDFITRKLRKKFTNTEYKDSQPTVEDLKKWESEKYPYDYSEINSTPQQNLSFNLEHIVNEILKIGTDKELALKREIVVKIIHHLEAGKNVILEGSPGVGKTELAMRILEIYGREKIGKANFIKTVASDIWSRYEIIGGLNMQNEFKKGHVTNASIEKRWLLIDEFNRADMNKAFGDMFLAIEHGFITLREDEKEVYGSETIEIPKEFRMICTMNDFDKNLLLSELSYGLISRFAFVSVNFDDTKEKEVIERKLLEEIGGDVTIYDRYSKQIEGYYNFINDVRKARNIGVRTSIDVIKYMITSTKNSVSETEKWHALNDALCDYVLPQFDRLDIVTLDTVHDSIEKHLTDPAFKEFKEEIKMQRENLRKVSFLRPE